VFGLSFTARSRSDYQRERDVPSCSKQVLTSTKWPSPSKIRWRWVRKRDREKARSRQRCKRGGQNGCPRGVRYTAVIFLTQKLSRSIQCSNFLPPYPAGAMPPCQTWPWFTHGISNAWWVSCAPAQVPSRPAQQAQTWRLVASLRSCWAEQLSMSGCRNYITRLCRLWRW
jgi:hypothetical protein